MPQSPQLPPQGSTDQFGGAKVKALRLKPVTTVSANSPCSTAIETMRDKGFDQLPVLAAQSRKLVGLITLGNTLSWISRGRATGNSPVSDVMFDFSKISEIITDPRNLGKAPKPTDDDIGKRKEFVEITMDTPLSVLNRFFEWNSAAVVTEKDESGHMKPLAVATKVDLLTWLLQQNKLS